MMHSRHPGFTVVEMMIALSFLVLATGLSMRLMQAPVELDRVSRTRLAKQLAVENLTQRMSAHHYDDLAMAIESLEKEALEQDPTSKVRIEMKAFEAQGRKGWHVIVSDESNVGNFISHFWRLEVER
jgi:type II secretory pathway component PulJ